MSQVAAPFLSLLILLGGLRSLQPPQEETEDYFKKWLEEDVRYIITDEEREIFQKLTTPEEKEQFIEQFWYRRDPDPRTAVNEFKEEHYRRIAYANERFSSGIPGWLTDRGRIYIIHGPPDEVTAYPSGTRYLRKPHEGGGSTSTFPFEIWRYRHLEGIGDDIELEFVDPTWAGQYKLTMDPDEKDALMRVPNAGLTLAEELGRASKAQRPFFQPGMRDRYPMRYLRSIDQPFARYERLVQAQRARPIKYQDLRQLVEVQITYDQLPFKDREDFFALDAQRSLVTVTVEVANRDLTFKSENGQPQARIAVYGIVTSIANHIVTEFDDDLLLTFPPEELSEALQSRSLYQKVLILDKGIRCRLDLVVKDLNSGRVGVVRRGLYAPQPEGSGLELSSLILADQIAPVRSAYAAEEMFVLGDIKVRPSVSHRFPAGSRVGFYIQATGFSLDQTTQVPSLATRYRLLQGDQVVWEIASGPDEGMRLYGDSRIAVVKILPTEELTPGRYRLVFELDDRIAGKTAQTATHLEIVEPVRLAAARR